MFNNKVDRSKIQQTSLEQADADDIQYWMSRTPSERIAGVEHLRRWIYGDAAVDKGLQRVLRAVELGED